MKQPTYCIGIDIASETFTVSFFVPTAVGTKKTFLLTETFANNSEEFHLLLAAFHQHHLSPDNAIACMEATGVYGEALCYFLAAHQYRIAVEPPLKVKRAFDIGKHKNDRVDSQQIAEYAFRFFDELTFWSPNLDIIEQIKVLLAVREQFTVQKTANMNALTSLKRKYVQTPLATAIYQQTIDALAKNIRALDIEIKKMIESNPTFRQTVANLTSIPGVGTLLASNLLVISNGFTQPLLAKNLAAYIGIVPYEMQSGTSVYRKPRARKYGPPTLRKLLYLAALSVRTHRRAFKEYFLRKVSEGKSKRLVINNIANKLIKIICAVIASNTAFIENYRSVNPMFLKTS